jgi:hypothetical protein
MRGHSVAEPHHFYAALMVPGKNYDLALAPSQYSKSIFDTASAPQQCK